MKLSTAHLAVDMWPTSASVCSKSAAAKTVVCYVAVLDTASASASYCHGAISFTASRVAHIVRRAHRAQRQPPPWALRVCSVQAPEYDLLQLAKPPHSGASVAFVAPCRRAALWLEEGLVSMPDRCAQVGARCANLAKRACRAGGDVRLGRIAALRTR